MTKEELEKATGQELIEQRNYCGVDGYYGDYLNDVNTEMLKRFNRLVELEKENALVKSLLYGTQRTCDNCGFVNCENFQRQRKSEPCSLYIPYQVRIKNLAHESDVLRESYNNSEMNFAFVLEQLAKAKKLLKILLENYVSEPEVFSDGSCEDNELLNLINEIKQFINNNGEINDR